MLQSSVSPGQFSRIVFCIASKLRSDLDSSLREPSATKENDPGQTAVAAAARVFVFSRAFLGALGFSQVFFSFLLHRLSRTAPYSKLFDIFELLKC